MTTRNKITFDKYVLRSPVTIIFTACSYLTYWARLHNGEEKGVIVAGATRLKKMAMTYAGARAEVVL